MTMIPYLRESPVSFGCKKFLVQDANNDPEEDEVALLKDCSKCKFAKYCSVACQKADWKNHKEPCRTLSMMAHDLKKMEEECPDFKVKREITIHEVEKILAERKIHYNEKCDDRIHDIIGMLKKYEDDDGRCKYLHVRLLHASVFWYYAEFYNSYFIYKKYYAYIKDLIKCCPVLMDHLIFYLIMSLINLGLDDEAFNVINVWNVEFKHEKSEDLVPLTKAILDDDWSRLSKYDKYGSIEESLELLKLLVTMRDQYDEDDFANNCEKMYQLFPFLPAILAIKIRNMLNLNTNRENFEDFARAVNGDNGMLKKWKSCYPGILQNIGSMILQSVK